MFFFFIDNSNSMAIVGAFSIVLAMCLVVLLVVLKFIGEKNRNTTKDIAKEGMLRYF